jgi:hypothetical protein
VHATYVSRVLRLTLLAPDIVEAILDGRQPAELRLEDLLAGFPLEWEGSGNTWRTNAPGVSWDKAIVVSFLGPAASLNSGEHNAGVSGYQSRMQRLSGPSPSVTARRSGRGARPSAEVHRGRPESVGG